MQLEVHEEEGIGCPILRWVLDETEDNLVLQMKKQQSARLNSLLNSLLNLLIQDPVC